jgi:hypothetical protein
MPHVYLPTEHSEADLVLAGQVAEALESDSLYVTWSERGYEEPQVETVVRSAPPHRVTPAPGPSLLTEVLGTMAAFLAAMFGPRSTPERRQPAAAPRRDATRA